MQTFDAIIEQEGKFTFVSLPFSPKEVWGSLPRFNIAGAINGIAVQGCLGALGTHYFLRLSATWLKSASLKPGSEVNVSLWLAK